MKISSLLLGLVLLVVPTYGETGWSGCSSRITDTAKVLKDTQPVETALQKLSDVGADPHVVTVTGSTNLDISEKNLITTCQNFQSQTGGIKSTLVLLMVSTDTRLMGIYFGHAFDNALANHFVRIKQDYMKPYFRSGDFSGGFTATANQIAARITASKDEAVHPAQTVNQATDYSGLWTAFKWIIFLTGLGGGIWFIFYLLAASSRRKENIANAQSTATFYKNAVSTGILKLQNEVAEAKALNKTETTNQAKLDLVLEPFSQLVNNIRTDPATDNLTLAEYKNMVEQYGNLFRLINPAGLKATDNWERGVQSGISQREIYTVKSSPKYTEVGTVDTSYAPRYVPDYYPSSPVIIPVPVIVDNEPSYFHRSPVVEDEPSYSHRSDDSDSGSSFGGGSSSYDSSSSSDSGSSSSYDSGGSSSFDSGGSSDFGGGGSSDF